MNVWPAFICSVGKPWSVTKRPKYEQRCIDTLLTLWATPDKRYESSRLSRTIESVSCPSSLIEQLIVRQIAISDSRRTCHGMRARVFFTCVPASHRLRHFATCSTKSRWMYLTVIRFHDARGFWNLQFLRILRFQLLRSQNLWLCVLYLVMIQFDDNGLQW